MLVKTYYELLVDSITDQLKFSKIHIKHVSKTYQVNGEELNKFVGEPATSNARRTCLNNYHFVGMKEIFGI